MSTPKNRQPMPGKTKAICLFLCGDVMTGRGVDQVLPHPLPPQLYEPYVRDARHYVQLAEKVHGPIGRNLSFDYLWGDALTELQQAGTDLRIVNLETSVTTSDDPWPEKGIHYRMHPRNIGCILAGGIDCCCLANNHVLDWGYSGLEGTLRTLDRAGLSRTGAGHNADEASSPAVLEVAGKGRVLVFALGSTTSGIPPEWGAAKDKMGINLLEDLSEETAQRLADALRRFKRPGDVIVASIHWGGNWGYEITDEQIRFAHRLIDSGVDLVHGHSSHHVKAIEVYQHHLILYGCGDFLNDYEGIDGRDTFRSDLNLMYLAKVEPGQGRLVEARLVPFQARRFRLNHASAADAKWLGEILNEQGVPFRTQVQWQSDNSLILFHGTKRFG